MKSIIEREATFENNSDMEVKDVGGMFLTALIVISFLFSAMSFLCTTKFVNVLPTYLIRV